MFQKMWCEHKEGVSMTWFVLHHHHKHYYYCCDFHIKSFAFAIISMDVVAVVLLVRVVAIAVFHWDIGTAPTISCSL